MPANAGDAGSVPGLGRSPGEGNGNPLQYSCLGNFTDREAWWTTVHGVKKSQTGLSMHARTKKKRAHRPSREEAAKRGRLGHPVWVQSPAQKPTLTLHQGKPKVPRVWCSEILSPTPTELHLSVLKDLPPPATPNLGKQVWRGWCGGSRWPVPPTPQRGPRTTLLACTSSC